VQETPTIREVAQVIRLIVSSLPGAKLHYRNLEKNKIIALQKSRGNYDAPMKLSTDSKAELS
jgi:hypothetical protein